MTPDELTAQTAMLLVEQVKALGTDQMTVHCIDKETDGVCMVIVTMSQAATDRLQAYLDETYEEGSAIVTRQWPRVM